MRHCLMPVFAVHFVSTVIFQSILTTLATTNYSSASSVDIPYEIDESFPVPTMLSRVSRGENAVTIRFIAPDRYRFDRRCSHFRVEYDSGFTRAIRDLEKTAASQVVEVEIVGLLSGVLYNFTVRCLNKSQDGNYVVSTKSNVSQIRTEPPPVSNIRVYTQSDTMRTILLAWDAVQTIQNGTTFNEFEVEYKITDELTDSELAEYQRPPITIPHFTRDSNQPSPSLNRTTTIGIEPGATYEFSITTKATGIDPTSSTSIKLTKSFPIPGPISLRKISSSALSIAVEWATRREITNISGHLITYIMDGSDEKAREITVNKDINNYNLTALSPGVLYSITIETLRDEMPFGKKSRPTTFYARTNPTTPNIYVNNIGKDIISIEVSGQFIGSVTSIFTENEPVNTRGSKSNRTSHIITSPALSITGLTPGLLYKITVIFSSGNSSDRDVTYSSANLLARTMPNPPKYFTGYGSRGVLLLRWIKPAELFIATVWTYEIKYYPVNNPANVTRINVGNRNGSGIVEHSLGNLMPATEYSVEIYTLTGRQESNDRVTRSIAAGPLRLYTQPESPRITKWTQVTIKRVRIEWESPPRSEDATKFYYSLNLTRIESNSSIDFKPEFRSYKIDSQESDLLIELSYGARYIVELTTVILNGDYPMHSVVNSRNREEIETWSPYDDHQLFKRFVWNFNTCGRKGRFGPVQASCQTAYKGTNLADRIKVKNGIQYWITPITGLYRITATGAGYVGPGGKGATVSGQFSIKEGTVLKIAIGQEGSYDGDVAQGGAGGTFVVSSNDDNEPLLVAGGAGTAFVTLPPSDIANGRLNFTGGDASEVGEEFGSAGDLKTLGPGLPGATNTAGGAGYRGISNSVINLGNDAFAAAGYLPFYGDDNKDGAVSVIIPLQGGFYESGEAYSEGGFGGGGSGVGKAAGGGGGYTGGGGGPENGYSGGGGSYIKYTGGQEYGEVVNTEGGKVRLTLIGLPRTTPTPIALYLVSGFLVGIGTFIFFLSMYFIVKKYGGRCGTKKTIKEDSMPLDRMHSPEADVIEASVHVTDITPNTPSMSGLYVRDVEETEGTSYRKFSEVDTESQLAKLKHRITVPPRIVESESENTDLWKPTINSPVENTGLVNKAYEPSESDESNDSSVSPVSSYNSDINKFADDAYQWDASDVDDSSGSRDSEDDANADSEGSSLPPPPPPPPGGPGKKPKVKKRTRSMQKTEFL